jgi:NO-binding membrane sensor protein with MHYT domain
MGVAVCGMHYTGMAAVEFVPNAELPVVEPMALTSTIFTLIIISMDAVIIVLAMAMAMGEANKCRFDNLKLT